MRHFFILGGSAIASASICSLTVYCPFTGIDGSALNAMGNGFFTGTSGPATYCPTEVGGDCPPVQGTLVDVAMSAMSVEVPGGQNIYVAPDGEVKYTSAHSSFMPFGSYPSGWYNKTAVSDCAPTTEIIDFLTTDGSNVGGLFLCPTIPDYLSGTGASYQLYAKTPDFTLTNCEPAVGLVQHMSSATLGCWQYM